MKRSQMITAAALFALLASAPGALAADVPCTGFLDGTINGNLNVPDYATCFLGNTTVTGNVTVGKGAFFLNLYVVDPMYPIETVTIGGNVQANNCGTVLFLEEGLGGLLFVGGNFQIQNCTTGNNGYIGPGVVIGGNVQLSNNTGPGPVWAFAAAVVGNVQVTDNTGAGANGPGVPPSIISAAVGGNIIVKNLQCQGNEPTVSNQDDPNIVLGNPGQSSEGQCQGL